LTARRIGDGKVDDDQRQPDQISLPREDLPRQKQKDGCDRKGYGRHPPPNPRAASAGIGNKPCVLGRCEVRADFTNLCRLEWCPSGLHYSHGAHGSNWMDKAVKQLPLKSITFAAPYNCKDSDNGEKDCDENVERLAHLFHFLAVS
jgi:hypothetical protein